MAPTSLSSSLKKLCSFELTNSGCKKKKDTGNDGEGRGSTGKRLVGELFCTTGNGWKVRAVGERLGTAGNGWKVQSVGERFCTTGNS